MGLGRLALARKDWPDAETRFNAVIENYPESKFAPQAVYFRGVSRYSISHESSDLAQTATELKEDYAGHEWQLRSIPWLAE